MRTTDATAAERYQKRTGRAWEPDARQGLLAAALVAAWDVLLKRLISSVRKPYGGRPLKQNPLPPWAKAVLEAEKDVLAASPQLAVFVLPEVFAILTSDELVDIPESHARPLHDALKRTLGEAQNAADLVLRAFFEARVAQAALEGVPTPKAAEITLLAAAAGLDPLGKDPLDLVRKKWGSRIARWKRDAPPPIIRAFRGHFEPASALANPGLASAIASAIGNSIRAKQQGPQTREVPPPIVPVVREQFDLASVLADTGFAAIGNASRAKQQHPQVPVTPFADPLFGARVAEAIGATIRAHQRARDALPPTSRDPDRGHTRTLADFAELVWTDHGLAAAPVAASMYAPAPA